MSQNHDEEKAENAERTGIPTWKKVLLSVALLFIVAGVVLTLMGDTPAAQPQGPGAASQSFGFGANSFVPGSPSPASTAVAEASPWAPFFIKGGFSLFLGFCIGYALRTFFKISAIAVGVLALALFALSYFGLITVDWNALSEHYDTFANKLKDEAGEFRTFVAGSLPSTGLASLGLFTGFKRN